MFEVRCESPMDDEWEERDAAITEAAGERSDWSGAGMGKRDHGWKVPTFVKAVQLKERLNAVPGVTANVREEKTP